jgi:hypothetical protein
MKEVEILNLWLNELKEKEKEVITLRFGLEDKKSKTLQEIGNGMGLTRERVRQIESAALNKLRHKYEAIRN